MNTDNQITTNFNWFSIESILLDKGKFYFWPNPGNFGDMLINYAEIQLFQRLKLNYTIKANGNYQEPFDLVIGGGGRFIDNYSCGAPLYSALKHPKLRSCLILSQSIRGCLNLIQNIFDERFTVIVREAKAYHHCIKLNKKTKFILANDLAFSINLSKISFTITNSINISKIPNSQNFIQHVSNQYKTYEKALKRYNFILQHCSYKLKNKTVNFYFRRDSEKLISSHFTSLFNSYDLPVLIGNYDYSNPGHIAFWCRFFLGIIDSSDIIFTDRLHVGIAGCILKKEVYLFDNSYQKASGVYQTTMACFPNIHLITNDNLSFPFGDLVQSPNYYLSEKIKPFMNLTFNQFGSEIYRFYNLSQF